MRTGVTALALLILAACSSHSAAAPTPTTRIPAPSATTHKKAPPTSMPSVVAPAGQSIRKPCTVLTDAEAGTFLGGPTHGLLQSLTQCDWTVTRGSSSTIVQLSLTDFSVHAAPFPGTHEEQVPDVGHGAIYVGDAPGGSSVYAQKGNKYLHLSLGGGSTNGTEPWKITSAARKAAFIALAKDALARM